MKGEEQASKDGTLNPLCLAHITAIKNFASSFSFKQVGQKWGRSLWWRAWQFPRQPVLTWFVCRLSLFTVWGSRCPQNWWSCGSFEREQQISIRFDVEKISVLYSLILLYLNFSSTSDYQIFHNPDHVWVHGLTCWMQVVLDIFSCFSLRQWSCVFYASASSPEPTVNVCEMVTTCPCCIVTHSLSL